MHCVGLAHDVSLRQMIYNKVDSHFKGLINHYYYYYYYLGVDHGLGSETMYWTTGTGTCQNVCA